MKKTVLIKGKGKYRGIDDKWIIEIKRVDYKVICKLTLQAYVYCNHAETIESEVVVSGDEAMRDTCEIDALKFLIKNCTRNTRTKILKAFENE